jgi:predicted TIM-barrel fold metal-dependent hydrolase
VIVDMHTHVFPPRLIERRERPMAADATFGELYGDPRAKLATADELLHSMDAAEVDVSVVLGFAWRDLATCRAHNDYLLEAAAASGGRIIAFCTLPLGEGAETVAAEARRCLRAGARGFGELRPENQGAALDGGVGEVLAAVAAENAAVLLFHVSEPVGHAYPGKGGFALSAFVDFVQRYPAVKTVGAHWGGGLPFYALMPEVGGALANCHVDTAASSLLYDAGIYAHGTALLGSEHVLFGSDFPLLSQKRCRERIEASGLDAGTKAAVLGENARKLLGLS